LQQRGNLVRGQEPSCSCAPTPATPISIAATRTKGKHLSSIVGRTILIAFFQCQAQCCKFSSARATNRWRLRACVSFQALAEEINQGGEGDSQDDDARHKTAPDESVNHVFCFNISRAPRTATRCLLKHVATVATGSCAHGH
jgi:hypothetical protein